VIWSLALAACPVAIVIVGAFNVHTGPPVYDGMPLPWAARVVDGLGIAQVCVSVIGSIAVVVLARGAYRWLAWLAIIVIGMTTAVLHLIASMQTTGVYL
jgi:hypothetical protein